MRFTIRDLLWLTAVVALGVAWWVDRQRLKVDQAEFRHLQRVTASQQRAIESYSTRLTALPEDTFSLQPPNPSAPAPNLPKN